MREEITRRYKALTEENHPLPDLILTDGGKGQMSAVKEALGELNIDIPIAGLAKDDKHRTSELLFGNPPQVIGLKQNSALFNLLENIHSEVHRFAIKFHRDLRSKKQVISELESIPGIGPVTKNNLLKKFKSVKRIREASEEELAEIVGQAKAKALTQGLKTK